MEGAEIHAPPCGIGGGHRTQPKCRMKDARPIATNANKCRAGAGMAILVPGTRRLGGLGTVGSGVRECVCALPLLVRSTPRPRNSLQPFDVLANWINNKTRFVKDCPDRKRFVKDCPERKRSRVSQPQGDKKAGSALTPPSSQRAGGFEGREKGGTCEKGRWL